MEILKTNYNVNELVHYQKDDDGLFSLLKLLHFECNKKNVFVHGVFCNHDNLIEDGYAPTENKNTSLLYSEGEIVRLDNIFKGLFNNRQFSESKGGIFNVYFFGSSTVYQPFVKHEDSLHCTIVKSIDEVGLCESIGFNHRFGERVAIISIIEKIQNGIIKKGDHVIFIRDGGMTEHEDLLGNITFDTTEVTFDKQSMFFDDKGHLSEKGIKKISFKIDKLINDKSVLPLCDNTIDFEKAEQTINEIKTFLSEKSLAFDKTFLDFQKYLQENKDHKALRCGSILVNCNPITLGHQFLIDTACSYVDRLYLFVIESEMNEFSFEDRFNMVKMNYEDNNKVTVLKGGKFMCSEYIIPDYFNKSEKVVSGHVEGLEFESFCFGRKIAPILNIKEIWLGEEPSCKLTNYYNSFMQQSMVAYGIDVNIINRKRKLGGVISASSVRAYIVNGEFSKVKRLVSPKTFSYLTETKRIQNNK